MDKESISMVRYRGSKLSKIKEIDLYPKVEESIKESSLVGGTLSVFCFLLIFYLIYAEILYYLNSKFVFQFSPDVDYEHQLKLNVDLTVAMPCDNIGADILDSTNQNAFRFGTLEEENTWYELSPNQQQHFNTKRNLNSYIREEYHAIQHILWRSKSSVYNEMPARNDAPNRPYDACRIYGSLILNKVAGNFHITAGKSLNLPRGHIHLSSFTSESSYNFSHRINQLNFGDPSPGIIHPLEGDEFITDNGMTLFQYFIEIVPTDVQTFFNTIKTYQYSAKELTRPIDHFKGSHGMPGIFFKYDMSALKVTVRQERDHITLLLARLFSIAGGIFVCSGFISSSLHSIFNFFIRLLNGGTPAKRATVSASDIIIAKEEQLLKPN